MDLIDFSTSTKQVFYAFHFVTLNGELIDDADWVAAFNGDVCVGHHQWTTGDCNNGTCTVVANGFDGTISTATQGKTIFWKLDEQYVEANGGSKCN